MIFISVWICFETCSWYNDGQTLLCSLVEIDFTSSCIQKPVVFLHVNLWHMKLSKFTICFIFFTLFLCFEHHCLRSLVCFSLLFVWIIIIIIVSLKQVKSWERASNLPWIESYVSICMCPEKWLCETHNFVPLPSGELWNPTSKAFLFKLFMGIITSNHIY